MSNASNKKLIASLKLILLLCIIVGIPAFLYLKYGAEIFSNDTVDSIVTYLNRHRSVAFLLIIALQIVQVVICFIPGQPIQFASSYMYGVWRGFLLSIIGAVIGTVISFYLAKLLGRDILHLVFDEEKLAQYKEKLNSKRSFLLAFLIYLIPGFPKDLVSYAAGISDMRFGPFLLAATAGRSPGMLGSLLLGHYFGTKNYKAMAIIAVIVAVILLICFLKRRSLTNYVDRLEKEDTEKSERSNE